LAAFRRDDLRSGVANLKFRSLVGTFSFPAYADLAAQTNLT
jgi:hypothetical protein